LNIYEYQAKEIFRQYKVAVPQGLTASDPDTARKNAEKIGGEGWVIKAQVLAGGRGKAGGIKVARTLDEVQEYAGEILGKALVTKQTGSTASKVQTVLVEQLVNIDRELYVAMAVDRVLARVVCIASSRGGVDIEDTAENEPGSIFKEYIDPITGLMPFQARKIAFRLGISGKEALKKAVNILTRLYTVFTGCDCSLAEINPLVITKENEIIALDAKLGFDDSALMRQPDIGKLRNEEEESPAEKMAREAGLSYISLEGSIGCMVNGAGLAMSTMDSIKFYGGQPANFLDVGGGASRDTVTRAFTILMSDKNVKAILVNIFGGILQCDLLAEGIVAACHEVKPGVPLVVRLEGTNVEKGRQILRDSGLNIISEDTMKDAAVKAVEAAH